MNIYEKIGNRALNAGLEAGEKMIELFGLNPDNVKISIDIINHKIGIENISSRTNASGKNCMFASSIMQGISGMIYKTLNMSNMTADVTVKVDINE